MDPIIIGLVLFVALGIGVLGYIRGRTSERQEQNAIGAKVDREVNKVLEMHRTYFPDRYERY